MAGVLGIVNSNAKYYYLLMLHIKGEIRNVNRNIEISFENTVQVMSVGRKKWTWIPEGET